MTQHYPPDLAGEHYHRTMARLHAALRPRRYLEVGVLNGETFQLSDCAALAIDPHFIISDPTIFTRILTKPSVQFFQTTSDDFFARHDAVALLGGPIDMAFLDGMHLCEFLLRDFVNAERISHRDTVLVLHDCLPVEPGVAEREHDPAGILSPDRKGWWLGDVWRTALLLKRRRPDLRMVVLDSGPSGLVCITRLNPESGMIPEHHYEEMRGWDLAQIGVGALHAEMDVQSERDLETILQGWGDSWRPEAERQVDHALMARFESLGCDGEFALVLDWAGQGAAGLFRWASIPSLAALLGVFATDFQGLGGDILWQTGTRQSGSDPVSLARQVREMRAILADPMRILVFKVPLGHVSDTEMLALHGALRRHGPAALLVVTPADPLAPAGTVRLLASGLLHGRIDHYAPPGAPHEVSFHAWANLCRQAAQVLAQ